ncbi:MAG: DUF892 family protein [Proteobacteria bacterium]|nr:DUF892 family protein [Pseudomonadota bacterium]
MQLVGVTVLLEELVGESYDAEHRLKSSMPQMLERVCHPALKDLVTRGQRQRLVRLERLEHVAQLLKCSIDGVQCGAVEGCIERLEEFIRAGGVPAVRDAALLVVVQQINQYQVSTYRSACDFAALLGLHDVTFELEVVLKEEINNGVTLADIASRFIYPDALQISGEHVAGEFNQLERVSYRR